MIHLVDHDAQARRYPGPYEVTARLGDATAGEPPRVRCLPAPYGGVECVQNLDEFHTRMVERNVACIQEPTETFGARIAQHVDPDGLAISVSEERRGP